MAQRKAGKIREILKGFLGGELSLDLSLHTQPDSMPLTLREKQEESIRRRKDQLKEESLKNRIVQEAVKIFDGRITEVREPS